MFKRNGVVFIEVELAEQFGLVLYDWLMSVEMVGVDKVAVDRSQKAALMALLAGLEISVDIGATAEQIAAAKKDAVIDMGWE